MSLMSDFHYQLVINYLQNNIEEYHMKIFIALFAGYNKDNNKHGDALFKSRATAKLNESNGSDVEAT